MKRSLLVCLFALSVSCCALAHDFMADSICYNILSEEDLTCEVTYNSDEQPENVYRKFYKGVVFVPEKVSHSGKQYTVTAIGENAFGHSDELLSVVLPSTIVSIGYDAFACCPNFKSLTIPENVRKFDNFSFRAMPSLEYLAVDENNEFFDSRGGCNAIIKTKSNTLYVGCRTTVIPDDVKVIANCAFLSGSGISSQVKHFELEIPESVEVIEGQAFAACTSLAKVSLSEGLKSIGFWAFRGTSIESVVIPASVTEIDSKAFEGCDLKTIKVKKGNKVYDSRKGCNAVIESKTDKLLLGCATSFIPKGIKEIGDFAFSNSKIKAVNFPSSVEIIGENAFFDCRELKSVIIPGYVRTVCSSAFHASAIEELTIEEGVENIGSSAFGYCRNLKSVSLPASLKNISAAGYCGIFSGCRQLERVRIGKGSQSYHCSSGVLLDKKTMTIVDGWGIDNCNVGYVSAKKVGPRAFRHHELLAVVVLPKTLEVIENSAFEGCNALRIIECKAVVPPVLGSDVFKLNFSKNSYSLPLQERTVVVVPTGSLDAYRNAPGWKEFKHIVESRLDN